MVFVILGFLLLLIGWAHRLPEPGLWDRRAFLTLNRFLARRDLIGLFRLLWPLGTTPAALLLLASTMILGATPFLRVSLAYIAAISLERMIKMSIRRPRPFRTLPDVWMAQPRQPSDASFPSGDVLRAWFLALLLPSSFELAGYWFLLAFLLALMITLGRIAMGVHYPLDAVAGAGIGIFFAGLYLI